MVEVKISVYTVSNVKTCANSF